MAHQSGKKPKYPRDITGVRFGKLVVIQRVACTTGRHTRWEVLCDCGTSKTSFRTVLTSGDAVSCGCERTLVSTKHGKSSNPTKLYRAWSAMKSRCSDSNSEYFKDYGGRGISVCAEWVNSFESFETWALSSGHEKHLELDRIDNNDNYTPTNCRWTTRTTQQRNRRSQKGSTSQYLGVSWCKRSKKWVASIKAPKSTHLGYYSTELNAALARDAYIITHHLKDFTMNFKHHEIPTGLSSW